MIINSDIQRIPISDNSVDLVFCSPPYEDTRSYGIEFSLRGQEWVDWAVAGFVECLRVCRGLVAWVVEGKTRNFAWSATPALMMVDLHRKGVRLRKPPAFKRVGIPGSGGPDWLRNDYELIVCATNNGKLPWSDNTVMGHPPKFPPGGPPSHHGKDGRVKRRTYSPPKKSNPGNVIKCNAGGGHMGSRLSHDNEAPFPEKLAEFFIRSFCPPGGVVLDPFGGSGTTAAVALKHERRAFTCDIRISQCKLTNRRLEEVEPAHSIKTARQRALQPDNATSVAG